MVAKRRRKVRKNQLLISILIVAIYLALRFVGVVLGVTEIERIVEMVL